MPLVGLGTWRMGNDTATVDAVKIAISVGYRHLDCALGYGNQLPVGQCKVVFQRHRPPVLLSGYARKEPAR